MNWWKWKRDDQTEMSRETDRQALVDEIRDAHQEWLIAQKRLDYVVDDEQIDYVIFALEAAEKRYEMLIKQAKKMQAYAGDYYPSRVAGE